jgi:maltose O-acetyltransferase
MFFPVLKPALIIISRRLVLLRRFRNLWLAKLRAAIAGTKLETGRKVCFDVPVRAHGEGSVAIGDGVNIGTSQAVCYGSGQVMLQARGPEAQLRIGPGTATNNNVAIYATESVELGRDCLLAELVTIYDSDFHELAPALRRTSAGPSAPVRIGDRVWLGSRVMVMKGVEIGDDSVIAAGAVVTSSIPASVLAGGVPAKVIRPLADEALERCSEQYCATYEKPVA